MIPFEARKAGDPAVLSATEINAWNAAALEHRGNSQSQTAPRGRQLPAGVVFVKNTTGGARKRFDVLALKQAVLDSAKPDYKRSPAFDGVQPDPENTPEHRSRVAILLEPAADGKFGRAAIFGQFAMPIEVLDTGHTRARVLDDHTLQSGFFGPVRILAAPETGTKQLCRVMVDGFDGGHCLAKVPSGGITGGTYASASHTTCTLAYPDPASGAAVDVDDTKPHEIRVTNWGPAIDSSTDYVQCRVFCGFITPDVAYC